MPCVLWLMVWVSSVAGCGFIDTVEKLVSLGADLNARDVTSCTPLQNAAHGTYSALAAMPPPNQPGASFGCVTPTTFIRERPIDQ